MMATRITSIDWYMKNLVSRRDQVIFYIHANKLLFLGWRLRKRDFVQAKIVFKRKDIYIFVAVVDNDGKKRPIAKLYLLYETLMCDSLIKGVRGTTFEATTRIGPIEVFLIELATKALETE